MIDAYIFDALRTPRAKGKSGGELHQVKPVELLATVLRALKSKHQLETQFIDDFILGCVTAIHEQGGNIAKSALQMAEFDDVVAGVTLNRFCASGLEAVNQAACGVMSGMHDLILAGGVESMSRVPMLIDRGPWMHDEEVMRKANYVPQGISADLIASLKNYDRKRVDEFALRSQTLAAKAQRGDYFKSIITVLNSDGSVLLNHDTFLRPSTTLESLGKLKPAFEELGIKYDSVALSKYPTLKSIQHVHHAGNSSGIVDGAAVVLIGNKEAGEKQGLKPRGKIKALAITSTEPTIMLTGPAPATLKALKRAKMKLDDIDLFEVNEAFASVVLNYVDELKIDLNKVNVNGGAIALGHPLGATGAMLIGTILDELERRDLETGLVTLCVGGGMGIATIIERV